MSFRYTPQLRPAGFATLPSGLSWHYVQAPTMHGLYMRDDLPTSRYRYGVIETDRELTAHEIFTFDLLPSLED